MKHLSGAAKTSCRMSACTKTVVISLRKALGSPTLGDGRGIFGEQLLADGTCMDGKMQVLAWHLEDGTGLVRQYESLAEEVKIVRSVSR